MSDLIDRQAAIEKISEIIWDTAIANDVKATLKELPSVQPEKRTDNRTETHACDCISRQAAIDALAEYGNGRTVYIGVEEAVRRIKQLPSAESEITECPMCPDCPDNCPLEVEHE